MPYITPLIGWMADKGSFVYKIKSYFSFSRWFCISL